MTPQLSSPLLLAVILLFSAAAVTASAFNITRLLGQYPEFDSFNAYLSKTNLSDEINRRLTITVLAIDDTAASALAGKPLAVVKDVLSAHVILDYFGPEKLQRLVLEKPSANLTTLFQASGRAVGRQGFLNVSVSADGDGVAFGSGVGGSPLVAKLVGPVAARPYNISVLQVSAAIFAPGIDPNPTPPPPPAPPAALPPAEAPGPIDEEADAPVAADAPEADVLAPRDAPASSPPEPEVSDADAGSDAEAPVSEKLDSSRVKISSLVNLEVVIIGMLLLFVAF